MFHSELFFWELCLRNFCGREASSRSAGPDPEWAVSSRIGVYVVIIIIIIIIIITYPMAQQRLRSFDRPLMRVSLSDSILATLIFY